jgi:hypothetical protein
MGSRLKRCKEQSIHTFTKCTNVETIAQRSMLCSADSSHSNGRYWIRDPEYGLMANPTRSTMNDSTYKTCIWKQKHILDADHYTSNLINPWLRVLREQLMVSHLLKKFPASYRAWRFITVYTRTYQWGLSSAQRIHSTPTHYCSGNRYYHCCRYLSQYSDKATSWPPEGSKFDFWQQHPGWLGDPRSLLFNGYWGPLFTGKEARACRWTLTST